MTETLTRVQITSNKYFLQEKARILITFFSFGTFLDINLHEMTSTTCSLETPHNYFLHNLHTKLIDDFYVQGH